MRYRLGLRKPPAMPGLKSLPPSIPPTSLLAVLPSPVLRRVSSTRVTAPLVFWWAIGECCRPDPWTHDLSAPAGSQLDGAC